MSVHDYGLALASLADLVAKELVARGVDVDDAYLVASSVAVKLSLRPDLIDLLATPPADVTGAAA